MCDLEAVGVSSILRFIRSVVALAMMLTSLDLSWDPEAPHGENETCRGLFMQAALLKHQRRGGFADESVKIKFEQAHSGSGQR